MLHLRRPRCWSAQHWIKTSSGTLLLEDRFTYDVWDHRIGKWVDADGAGPGAGFQSWTAYAGDNPYADFDSAGALTMRYLFGLGLAELYARRDSAGNVAWYLADMLGSVRQIVNTSGTVLDAITYDSFGNIVTETQPSNGDRFKFAGMQWDSEIGQYYVWHRHYLAGPGRFESNDPLGFEGRDTNLYRYVLNQPIRYRDPSGLGAPAAAIAIGGYTLGGLLWALLYGTVKYAIPAALTMEMILAGPNKSLIGKMMRRFKDLLDDVGSEPQPAPQPQPALTGFRPAVAVAVDIDQQVPKGVCQAIVVDMVSGDVIINATYDMDFFECSALDDLLRDRYPPPRYSGAVRWNGIAFPPWQ